MANPFDRALKRCRLLALGVVVFAGPAAAQTSDSLSSPDALKQMSLEELMTIEVSSVSRRPERLSEAASVIQVITPGGHPPLRCDAPAEALRLAGNLEVAQLDAAQWAISARGFNSPLANKPLVLIDGRTVYSPLFAGVFWDAQDVLLEDIEQIEVISGPGATLWGANAVNGVINITKGEGHAGAATAGRGRHGAARLGWRPVRWPDRLHGAFSGLRQIHRSRRLGARGQCRRTQRLDDAARWLSSRLGGLGHRSFHPARGTSTRTRSTCRTPRHRSTTAAI
jgi:hypothetical protein